MPVYISHHDDDDDVSYVVCCFVSYLARRSQAENLTREILEFEGNLKKLEKLVTLIQQPLDQFGSGQAPLASDIHNIAEPVR